MVMVACRTCGIEQPQDAFYVDKTSKSGYRSNCKTCQKAQSAKWAKENPARYAELQSQHYHRNSAEYIAKGKARHAANPEVRRRSGKLWAAANREHLCAKAQEWQRANPQKLQAHIKARVLDRDKPDVCSACGRPETRLDKHHEDYSRPLDIQWLCGPCHVIADNNRRQREKAAA